MDKYKNNAEDMGFLVPESLFEHLLLENAQIAKKIFSTEEVEENEMNYEEFSNHFKETPEFLGLFAKLLIDQGRELEEIEQVYSKILDLKNRNISVDINPEKIKHLTQLNKELKKLESAEEDNQQEDNSIEKENIVKTAINLDKSDGVNDYADTPPTPEQEEGDIPNKSYSDYTIEELVEVFNLKRNESWPRGYYCLADLFNTEDIQKEGQGLYIWTEGHNLFEYIKDKSKKTLPWKFGQYGSFVKRGDDPGKQYGKTPIETVKSYRHAEQDITIIVYAKRLDEYLKSEKNINNFKTAYDAEQVIGGKIKNEGGVGDLSYLRNTEVFKGVPKNEIIKLINETLKGSKRLNDYEMRPEQKIAHNQIVDYFSKGGKEFLLAAKMRYGKNFTFLNVAKTLNLKNILVLTYKPHVFDSLEKDVTGHTNFEGWEIINFKNERNLEPSAENTRVFMSSAQLALHEGILNEKELDDEKDIVEEEENKAKDKALKELESNMDKLANIDFDIVIADEYHYGTSTKKFNNLLEKLDYKHIIYVSGTAMKDIEMGRFEDDQIYSWSYIDEQKKKEQEKKIGYGSHIDMPTMNFHLMSVAENAKNRADFYTPEEGFTMNKMINVENGKLRDELSLRDLLRQISGHGVNKNISVFKNPKVNVNLDHTFWVLPKNTKGIKAVADLMETMDEFKDYYIIPATGSYVTDIKKVQQQINEAKIHNKKTITLSCYRFKEGVTVPDWNGVVMLDSGRSPEEYLQAIFRCQSPGENKDTCHVFDFNPQRCLIRIYDMCESVDKTGGTTLGNTITEFIDYAPILDHQENKFKEVNAEMIFQNFRAHGSFREKFANIKNINIEKLDQVIIDSLEGVRGGPRKKETDINDNDVDFGSEIIRTRENGETDDSPQAKKKAKQEAKKYLEKIANVLSNIPEYLFNSPENEQNVKHVVISGSRNPELFKDITGISIQNFRTWFHKGLLNKVIFNRNIKNFLDAENKFLASNMSLKEKDEFFKQHFNLRAEGGATPANLVNEMLDKLPDDIWSNKEKTFCDPCMGTGTFLLGIKERLMEGLKDKIPNQDEREQWIIENMIYGYDIDQSKVNMTKKLLYGDKPYKSNIEKKDMLKED